MVDRKPTYKNRITLTRQDGSKETVTWAYADNPLVEGTPLSKATLMPDELAAKLCPDLPDPTPADGMESLWKGSGWWYTAVFTQSVWGSGDRYPQYTFRQAAEVTAVNGGPAFTNKMATDQLMVNLTGNPVNDAALLEDLAVISGGFKISENGLLRVFLMEKPKNLTSIQVYFRGYLNE